jgi:hypothetical protein
MVVTAQVSSKPSFDLYVQELSKSRISKGDTACSEHVNLQAVGRGVPYELTAAMGSWRLLRARMWSYSLSNNIDYLIKQL